MTNSPNNTQNRLPKSLRKIVHLTVFILGLGVFFGAGAYSLLIASKTTLNCQINQQTCRLIRSTLISRQSIEFPITQLEGAYMTQTGTVMLRIQPEYQLSEGIYDASSPYGQDILQQAIANQINAFVQNPTTDFRLSLSNRLFKYVVGFTLLTTASIFPTFLVAARQTGRSRRSLRLPMVMISLSLLLSGVLIVVAINHRIELNCASQTCVLSAWRLQARGTINLPAEVLREAHIRQKTHTNDEGNTQTLYQVVLMTDQGDFSLLANSRATPAIALAEQVNHFINNPEISQVNFRTDNWLLTAALGGLCGLMAAITLLFAFRY